MMQLSLLVLVLTLSLAVRFLEGQNRNESSQGQEDLKFKTILNCQSTPFKLSLQRKWNLILSKKSRFLVARNIKF